MKKAREDREFKRKMTERGYGEQTSNSKPAAKKQSVKRPTNYTKPVKKEEKPSRNVVEVSKSNREELKEIATHHNVSKRRSPQERNEVYRATKSSQAKKSTNPPVAKPAPKTAKSSRPAREIQRKQHEDQEKEQFEEQNEMYQHMENERQNMEDNYNDENEADSNEMQDNDRFQDDIAQYANQESPDYRAQYDDDEQPEQQTPDEKFEGQEDQPSQDEEGEGNPLLFVDVNLGPGRSERIVVYEGDTAEQLADEFTKKHGLDESLKEKLVKLLENQIAGLLARIDEELTSNDTENHD